MTKIAAGIWGEGHGGGGPSERDEGQGPGVLMRAVCRWGRPRGLGSRAGVEGTSLRDVALFVVVASGPMIPSPSHPPKRLQPRR